jgi:3-methyl-2-oxobutanoate hydroxymethyltransferase
MVIQGHDTTVPVTLEHIIYHCKAVAKGLFRPFLMADMPFMTYTSREKALQNAMRLMQEGGAKMVKLEGGAGQVEIVEFLASHDIAVCAHLGLRPQSVHKTGGFRVQGREDAAADQMKRDAVALQNAGADVVLLECIPSKLGKEITDELHVPVIGIGAGPDTDGQILVLYDVLDITPGRKPRFVQNFMAGHDSPVAAIESYVKAVKSRAYPAPEHCF